MVNYMDWQLAMDKRHITNVMFSAVVQLSMTVTLNCENYIVEKVCE
jgi:hypothetical protein